MLKYITFIVLVIGLYWYFAPSKKSVAGIPSMPKTVVKNIPSPRRIDRTANGLSVDTKNNLVNAAGSEEQTYTYPEIQKLIESNDVCGIKKIIDDIRLKNEPPIFIDALFEATDLRQYKKLFGVEGPLFKSQEGKNLSIEQKIIDALAGTDLLRNHKREPQDLEQSLKKISDISSNYPNSVDLQLYKMFFEQQLGRSKAVVKDSLRAAVKAEQYNNFFQSVRTDLSKNKWQSESIFYLTSIVLNEMPSVTMSNITDLIDSIGNEQEMQNIGEKLVKKGLESKRTHFSEEFSREDYYHGNDLLGNKHPQLFDLAEIKEPGKVQDLSDNWVSYDMYGDICDKEGLSENFSKNRYKY